MGKALVVDDSRAVRMILARILKENGYEVAEAANGREALATIRGREERPVGDGRLEYA